VRDEPIGKTRSLSRFGSEMGGVLFTCLTSREALECESNALHHLGDLLGGPRKCPHCGGNFHQPPEKEPKRKSKH